MVEVALHISDEQVSKFKEKLGNVKLTKIVKDALALYFWAVEERAKRRVIWSANPDGTAIKRLAMKSLDSVFPCC